LGNRKCVRRRERRDPDIHGVQSDADQHGVVHHRRERYLVQAREAPTIIEDQPQLALNWEASKPATSRGSNRITGRTEDRPV